MAFFNGVQEGYLTMDALAAFVFGIIVIDAIRSKGASTKRQFLVVCFVAGLIAASILAAIYSFLSYLGASTVAEFGYLSNGGAVLSAASHHFFGTFGGVLLGGIVLLACLTTSIGLTTSCSTYLQKLMPAISYRTYAIGLSVFSTIMANFGLNELISISVPVLKLIYPLAVVLIALTFLHSVFGGLRSVYYGSLLITLVISLIDLAGDSGLPTLGVHDWFSDYLPLYDQSLGWILPAVVGGLFGLFVGGIMSRR